jgi:hypothetical protein
MKASEMHEGAIEIFSEQFVRHIAWDRLMADFLPVWDSIVIEKSPDGSITVKCYGKKE